MTDVTPTPKTQVRQETKSRSSTILEHALRVFATQGYANADVQVIADNAGVGKGTVYRHFGNKQELFLATCQDCLERLGEYVRCRLAAPEEIPALIESMGTAEVLRAIALSCAKFYQDCPEAIEMMILERAAFRDSRVPSHLIYRGEHRTEVIQLFQTGMQRGEFRDIDPAEATNAYADLIFGSVVNGCLEGGTGGLVERMTHAIDIFLHGVINKKE